MSSNVTIVPSDLPNSLNLSPHLSAHKYFYVCTLTVAAWDSLVLSPRTYKLWKTDGWPILKSLFFLLRLLMPAEFVIVGVAFFDTDFSQSMCQNFYLFEPICTAILLACCSFVHVMRVYAIHDQNRRVLGIMSALLAVQIVVTAICCAFYRSVPLLDGQGCIAGPKANWVGIYWLSATLVYTASLFFATSRSVQSLEMKQISAWKLMLRDGLNLYGAIWVVNMVNMLFWFIVKPTDTSDTIKTTVTSMTAVLTVTMTLRIILAVRGGLARGGTFAGAWSTSSGTHSHSHSHSRGTATNPAPGSVLHIQSGSAPTHYIDGLNGKKQPPGWPEPAVQGGVKALESKEGRMLGEEGGEFEERERAPVGLPGVQVTVQREVVDQPMH
ncbi:hypothetical protein PENSPDRAFT_659197 [Peniophora sp. CONT]|nr:hypothetical protein PENSPDRAFT_659197 [Peniophora sp. CONT]